MERIEGNIIDVVAERIFKGRIFYNDRIVKIEEDDKVISSQYILPGLVDAHVHIESSMLSPLEYSKVAIRHGVLAAISDPHEIANVCGVDGVDFMLQNAALSPMKIATGAPSCVPATRFETSGAEIGAKEIDELFKKGKCTHLSEMMNFPGVIQKDAEIIRKLNTAHKYRLPVDGHAPMLSGSDLKRYVSAGISTDHECTTVEEAIEKIALGMKIMLRQSSASRDFEKLMPLIESNPGDIMFCTDDCHPDELLNGYINELVKTALHANFHLWSVLKGATVNAVRHYKLGLGLLQEGDSADFIVVNNLDDFDILSSVIDGSLVFDGNTVNISVQEGEPINNFFQNTLSIDDLKVRVKGGCLRVIEVIPDSLLTKALHWQIDRTGEFIESDTKNDILKIVVLNRYSKAKPVVGFIRGFQLKKGAIAGTIAHDSHNIVAVGVSDIDLLMAIEQIQKMRGGLLVYDGVKHESLALPIAGLMSDQAAGIVAEKYKILSKAANDLGCTMHAPFMTMAFMSLLVIPELKIGDRGLFDVNRFAFVDLQIQ
ncbi:adenine deaminase [Roseimarinus sediminis]|uniref:adenine deaminase n=1 Tax=Roseimarinus sediminis TaxID=1610899 RepID=UPI003D1CC458